MLQPIEAKTIINAARIFVRYSAISVSILFDSLFHKSRLVMVLIVTLIFKMYEIDQEDGSKQQTF
jgi:hypothetical protein